MNTHKYVEFLWLSNNDANLTFFENVLAVLESRLMHITTLVTQWYFSYVFIHKQSEYT